MSNQTTIYAAASPTVSPFVSPGLEEHLRQHTGAVQWEPGSRVADLMNILNAKLLEIGLQAEERDFDTSTSLPGYLEAIPATSGRLACYPVRGGSEGYYIQIEWVVGTEGRHPLAMAKTYSQANALALANATCMLLDI